LRCNRRAMVSGVGFEGPALGFGAVSTGVSVELREEFQDTGAGDKRRARLPGAIHAGARVLHGASEDGGAFAVDHLFERGSLAELVRDGFLLHRSPRVVSKISWGRRASVDNGAVPEKRSLRFRGSEGGV